MKPSESIYFALRGLRYHVRAWGDPKAPVLVMLHGWMDLSASFQFLVDELRHDWRVLAPDWRGFGMTAWAGQDSYWYSDYLADLDALLDELIGDSPALIVAHSMGGNVACLYAGVRPDRVAALVNLEGLGLRDTPPEEAPDRYAQWLEQLRLVRLGKAEPRRDYASHEELAERLKREQPRLSMDQARFLAEHQGIMGAGGRVVIRSDPAHKRVNPVLYRGAEVLACLRRIKAPVLWVEGAKSEIAARFQSRHDELIERKRSIEDLTEVVIQEAGHMLHHHQPAQVARVLERFLVERGFREGR